MQATGKHCGIDADMLQLLKLASQREESNSLEDLARAWSSSVGLQVQVARLDVQDVRYLHWPVLLHVKSAIGGHVDRYALVQNCDDQHVTLKAVRGDSSFELPTGQLRHIWDGEALVFARQPLSSRQLHWRSGLLSKLAWILVALGAGGFLVSIGRAPSTERIRWRSLAIQSFGLLVVTAVGGLAVDRLYASRLFKTSTVGVASTQPLYIDLHDVQQPVQPFEVRDISPTELGEQLANGPIQFVDARPEEEFRKGHAAGALLLERFDAQTVRLQLAGLAPDTFLVVYCSEPACPRGQAAAAACMKAGFTHVTHFREGWAKLGKWDKINVERSDKP